MGKEDCWHPTTWMSPVLQLACSLLEYHGPLDHPPLLGPPLPGSDGAGPATPARSSSSCAGPSPADCWCVLGRQLPLDHPQWLARHLLLTRHLLTRHMLGRHLLGRHLPGRHLPGCHLLGRPQLLSDPSLLLGRPLQLQILQRVLAGSVKESPWWFFFLVTGQRPGTAVPPVWRRRMNQTSQHFHVFHLDDDQAETCDLPTPSMMMKTGTYDHPMTCDDGDGNERKTWRPDIRRPRRDMARPPVESACLLDLDPPDDVGRAHSPSQRPLSCLEEWWDLGLRSPLRELLRSDPLAPEPPSDLGRPTTDTLEVTNFLGSRDLECRPADFSTSVAFDPEPVAVLALFVLDHPSLLRLVGGSWRASSGACISTESSIVSLLGLLCRLRRLTSALLFVGFLLSLPGLWQPILADLTGRVCSTQSEALVQTTLLAAVVVVIASVIVRAARELELRLGGRRPITWLGFRYLVNTDTAGYGDEIKATSWPKAPSTNAHTWERLTSVTATTSYLHVDALICLGRPLGQCVFRLTSAHERGENWSERQVDTVLCAGAAVHGAERGLDFIVWNFAWEWLASRLYAATATTFLMKRRFKPNEKWKNAHSCDRLASEVSSHQLTLFLASKSAWEGH